MADSTTNLDNLPGTALLDNFGGSGALTGRAPEVGFGGFLWEGGGSATVSGGLVSPGQGAYYNNADALGGATTGLLGARGDLCFRMGATLPLEEDGNAEIANLYWGNNSWDGGNEFVELSVRYFPYGPSGGGAPGYYLRVAEYTYTAGYAELIGVTREFFVAASIAANEDCWCALVAPRAGTREAFWNGTKVGEYSGDSSSFGRTVSWCSTSTYSSYSGAQLSAVRLSPAVSAPPPAPDPFWTGLVKTREQLE